MTWQVGASPKQEGLYWTRTSRGFGGQEIGYHAAYWSGSYWRFRDGNAGMTGRTVTHFQIIEEPQPLAGIECYEDGLDRLPCAAQVEKGVQLTTRLAK